ncbi:hypothetical protein RER_13160 [Rhodococcus erythropolis PR4]|uniref:Uncharacterized protein n=1 Tax=Rhodococcus erythropolis (strain PR4 / NBRC 100887) TaxID=234621 RepID=C0ZT51_RHOE4|nr:hypothetical protein RER_13160 [Rhodococcus erythropolis PR4]
MLVSVQTRSPIGQVNENYRYAIVMTMNDLTFLIGGLITDLNAGDRKKFGKRYCHTVRNVANSSLVLTS